LQDEHYPKEAFMNTEVEQLPEVLTRMKKIPKGRLLARLPEKGVTTLTETQLVAVEEDGVLLKEKDGEVWGLKADLVIFAVDAVPENSLLKALQGQVKETFAVGDAASPGNLGSALRSATSVALKI